MSLLNCAEVVICDIPFFPFLPPRVIYGVVAAAAAALIIIIVCSGGGGAAAAASSEAPWSVSAHRTAKATTLKKKLSGDRSKAE